MDYSNPFAQFLQQPQQQPTPEGSWGQQQALVDALRQPQQQQAAPMAAPMAGQSALNQAAGIGGMGNMAQGGLMAMLKSSTAAADPLSEARQHIAARDGIMGLPTQGG